MIKTVSPSRKLQGQLTVPADKSISQRAAIFALLHDGISEISNYSSAQDPQSALRCVQQLGATVESSEDSLTITGVGRSEIQTPLKDLDCGNSGTAMRLLAGVLAGSGVAAKLIGDASLCGRTMGRIITPLEKMGAHILARNGEYAPLYVTREGPLKRLTYELPIPSAQLKSCLLLAGLFGDEPTEITELLPSRDHTERLLGLRLKEDNGHRVITASRDDEIPAQNYVIPGDFSASAFWLTAGAIHPEAELILENVGLNPTRSAFLKVLDEMGADITVQKRSTKSAEPAGTVTVKSSGLKAVEVEPKIIPNCIDELPTLAVAMLFAEGTSVISGAEELRHKETDRIMAIAEMLKAVEADFEEKEDGLIIHGNPEFSFDSAAFNSFHDHRIAMAAAVLALKGRKESQIHGAESAAVSYPEFWNDLVAISQAE